MIYYIVTFAESGGAKPRNHITDSLMSADDKFDAPKNEAQAIANFHEIKANRHFSIFVEDDAGLHDLINMFFRAIDGKWKDLTVTAKASRVKLKSQTPRASDLSKGFIFSTLTMPRVQVVRFATGDGGYYFRCHIWGESVEQDVDE